MKLNPVSTSMMSASLRMSVAELQSKYLIAQKESATGRAADVGLHLGNRASETLVLRAQFSQFERIKQVNSGVEVRMDSTQVALTAIVKDAENFLSQLLGMRDQPIGSDVVQSLGQTRLQALTELLNTGLDGAHLFAGINTDKPPLVDYYGSGTPTNKAGIDAAFFGEFGFTQDDPAAEYIDAASMQAFLDGALAARFEEPAWSAEWSNASDTVMKDMISLSERVPTSVTANDESLRKLTKAYTMVAELGLNGLNNQAYSVIINEATRLIGEAVQDVATAQAHLGNSQQRIKFANEKIERQVMVLNGRIADMEAIDPYEAHARVLELKTQIEVSYELTVRIQSLSLINHL